MKKLTDHLRVTVLPLDIQPADKAINLKSVADAFAKLPAGTDLVVLPELFSTGYCDDEAKLRELSERNTQETVDFIKQLSSRYSVAIAGSFLASTPPYIYNRGFIIEPNGDETFYDKHHLFSISREAMNFAPGTNTKPIVRFRGWNIALVVCYDLRFPAWCRVHDNDYDLLVVVANWPSVRAYAWEHLLIARAIENQCYVVGANRSGSDDFGDYDGLCRIYDSRGYIMDNLSEKGPFVVADLSREKQESYRRGFPVSNDADDFEFIHR